jgi:hypothetical protein
MCVESDEEGREGFYLIDESKMTLNNCFVFLLLCLEMVFEVSIGFVRAIQIRAVLRKLEEKSLMMTARDERKKERVYRVVFLVLAGLPLIESITNLLSGSKGLTWILCFSVSSAGRRLQRLVRNGDLERSVQSRYDCCTGDTTFRSCRAVGWLGVETRL